MRTLRQFYKYVHTISRSRYIYGQWGNCNDFYVRIWIFKFSVLNDARANGDHFLICACKRKNKYQKIAWIFQNWIGILDKNNINRRYSDRNIDWIRQKKLKNYRGLWPILQNKNTECKMVRTNIENITLAQANAFTNFAKNSSYIIPGVYDLTTEDTNWVLTSSFIIFTMQTGTNIWLMDGILMNK